MSAESYGPIFLSFFGIMDHTLGQSHLRVIDAVTLWYSQ